MILLPRLTPGILGPHSACHCWRLQSNEGPALHDDPETDTIGNNGTIINFIYMDSGKLDARYGGPSSIENNSVGEVSKPERW